MNLSSYILNIFENKQAKKEFELKELNQHENRTKSEMGSKLLANRTTNRSLKYQELLNELVLLSDENGIVKNLKTKDIAEKLNVTNNVVYGLITTLIKYKHLKQLTPKCSRCKTVKILNGKVNGVLAKRDFLKDKKIVSDLDVLKYLLANKDKITNEITATYREIARALDGEWWHVNSSILRLINVNKIKIKKMKHPQKGNTYEILEGETQCN